MVYPYNNKLEEQLSSRFQLSGDGSLAWQSAVGALKFMPGILGTWSMAELSPSGNVRDLTDNSLTLTRVGALLGMSNNNIPCMVFDASNTDRLYRTDANLDVVGNESYIGSGRQGLSLGCWFRLTSDTSDTQVLMGKWVITATNDRSYILRINSSLQPQFIVSNTGSDSFTVTNTNVTLSTGVWYFAAGVYDPSTVIQVWINDQKTENTTSIPATLHASGTNADFEVGSQDGGDKWLDGRVSAAYICQAHHQDVVTRRFYYRTRGLFQTPNNWVVS